MQLSSQWQDVASTWPCVTLTGMNSAMITFNCRHAQKHTPNSMRTWKT